MGAVAVVAENDLDLLLLSRAGKESQRDGGVGRDLFRVSNSFSSAC
jgi:hypothetical protein